MLKRPAKLRKSFRFGPTQHVPILFFVVAFAAIGSAFLLRSMASSPSSVSVESGDGSVAGCAQVINDTSASKQKAVKFGYPPSCYAPPSSQYGATLPINYSISSLGGTLRYVSTTGSDTTGNGTIGAPYATLTKAVSVAASGDSIVIRGGTYRQGNVTIPSSKTLRITAYPGEIPTFNGAQSYASGWVDEGGLKYHAYTPQPVTNGSGIDFINGQNLTAGAIGKYPDQAWVGTTQLRQVGMKGAVVDGTFWVDSTNNRMYMTAADVNKSGVEASQLDTFMDVNGPRTRLEGIIVTRFSNTASDGGVIKFRATADNSIMQDVEVYEAAFIGVQFLGGSDLQNGSTLKKVTIENANWMASSALYTDNLTFDAVKLRNSNQFKEFTNSPQSGALKTSRTRYTKIVNSLISNNWNHGLWFDQSNVDVDVANNQILDNEGSGIYFEISDDLLLVNNYIRARPAGQPIKLAGSSGLKLVNNTFVGGGDPIGIYTDIRSIPGCSDPAQPVCANSFGSDRDTVRPRPATLDWMPRLDLMINNIVAYPARIQFCQLTTVCIGSTNGPAVAPVETIIHQADASRGIPRTFINANVYANGTGKIVHTAIGSYSTIPTFVSAMATSPVSIPGFEVNGQYGNSWVNTDGSPTSALAGIHGQAAAVPTDVNINQYIPAGTKHYGVTYK